MSSLRSTTTCLRTRKVVTLDYTHPKTAVDFPSRWFHAHPGAKPPLTIPTFDVSSADLIRAVKGGIRGTNLTLQTAKIMLHENGKRMISTLTEDWRSYGVDIGKGTENITPWSTLDVSSGERHVPPEAMSSAVAIPGLSNPDDPHHWSERALVLFIVGVYRLLKVTNDDHLEILQRRMEEQLKAEGGKGISMHGVKGLYGGWINDKGYLRMIAAIDMFLHKFKDHPDSILRLGTQGSRMRDCAALTSLGHAMMILNISSIELMEWAFLDPLGDDLRQIASEDEESGKVDSYFPYQSDMGLVTKSAYSSNANPYLFTWIHIFGAILGHKRSINARFIFEGSYADIGTNAVLVARVFSRGGDLRPQFEETGADYDKLLEAIDDDESIEEGESEEDARWRNTEGREPQTWYSLLKSNRFQFPKVVVKAIKRQRDKLREIREDTMGDFVKNKLLY